MPNVFESEWEVEIPGPWNVRFARVGGPSISAFRREDAVDRMADEPGG